MIFLSKKESYLFQNQIFRLSSLSEVLQPERWEQYGIQSTLVSFFSCELAPPTPFPHASAGSPPPHLDPGGDALAGGGGGGGGANSDDRTCRGLWHSVFSVYTIRIFFIFCKYNIVG
jgi:hypothetical protein